MYIGGKYYPLKHTAAISLSLLVASLAILLPIALLSKDVPFSGWVTAYSKLISVGGILASTAIFMAWVFCELKAMKLRRLLSALIYSILCPLYFILTLGFVMLMLQGAFLDGAFDPEGRDNLLLILAVLCPTCFCIYWSASKAAN